MVLAAMKEELHEVESVRTDPYFERSSSSLSVRSVKKERHALRLLTAKEDADVASLEAAVSTALKGTTAKVEVKEEAKDEAKDEEVETDGGESGDDDNAEIIMVDASDSEFCGDADRSDDSDAGSASSEDAAGGDSAAPCWAAPRSALQIEADRALYVPEQFSYEDVSRWLVRNLRHYASVHGWRELGQPSHEPGEVRFFMMKDIMTSALGNGLDRDSVWTVIEQASRERDGQLQHYFEVTWRLEVADANEDRKKVTYVGCIPSFRRALSPSSARLLHDKNPSASRRAGIIGKGKGGRRSCRAGKIGKGKGRKFGKNFPIGKSLLKNPYPLAPTPKAKIKGKAKVMTPQLKPAPKPSRFSSVRRPALFFNFF